MLRTAGAGTAISAARPQPADGVSLAPKITVDDARVDWTTPALHVDRRGIGGSDGTPSRVPAGIGSRAPSRTIAAGTAAGARRSTPWSATASARCRPGMRLPMARFAWRPSPAQPARDVQSELPLENMVIEFGPE